MPRSVFVATQQVVADQSGKGGRAHLSHVRNLAARAAIQRAAFCPRADGTYRKDWADLDARRVVALGCALWRLSQRTRRKDQWRYVVIGYTRGLLAALIGNPFRRVGSPRQRPSLSALSGRHRKHGSLERGSLGYLRRLEAAGFCYRMQIRPDLAEPSEACFPSGHPPSRYYITGGPSGYLAPEINAELLRSICEYSDPNLLPPAPPAPSSSDAQQHPRGPP